MGRSPCCCHDAGVKKGPWTEEEDRTLVEHIQKHGGHVGSWRGLPKAAGLNRCGKSCRLRWTNYLRPDIKRGNFTDDEEGLIVRLHSSLGNKWSTIATHLEGRTDNEIKNYWNTHIRKKLLRMGIDPVTHQRLPLDHLDGAFASPILPEGFLSAAASLGSLDSALRQVQLLQQLLQAVGSNNDSTSLTANLAASNAMLNSSSIVPNFQEQMNMLARTSYQTDYLCNVSNFAEQGVVQQQQRNTAAPGLSSYAAEPTDQYCDPAAAAAAAAACVCAAYPHDIAAAVDRPVQEFASLEPMELPNLCSLESDPFWKDVLENSYRL